MLDVECPKCANKMQAPHDFAGKRAKCVKCGHAFAVIAPAVEFLPVLPQSLPQPLRTWTRILRHRLVAPIAASLGGLVFFIGLLGICLALSMDPTVEASPLDKSIQPAERVYNAGRMHQREIAFIGSATAALAGMIAIGFSALCLRIGSGFPPRPLSQ
jgi:hypothetical protein